MKRSCCFSLLHTYFWDESEKSRDSLSIDVIIVSPEYDFTYQLRTLLSLPLSCYFSIYYSYLSNKRDLSSAASLSLTYEYSSGYLLF